MVGYKPVNCLFMDHKCHRHCLNFDVRSGWKDESVLSIAGVCSTVGYFGIFDSEKVGSAGRCYAFILGTWHLPPPYNPWLWHAPRNACQIDWGSLRNIEECFWEIFNSNSTCVNSNTLVSGTYKCFHPSIQPQIEQRCCWSSLLHQGWMGKNCLSKSHNGGTSLGSFDLDGFISHTADKDTQGWNVLSL